MSAKKISELAAVTSPAVGDTVAAVQSGTTKKLTVKQILEANLTWCVFDGTGSNPITITAGNNVTNVTKNSTGKYTINFTTPMDSANYAVLGLSSGGTRCTNTQTGYCIIVTYVQTTGALANQHYVAVAIVGEVA